MDLDPLTSDFNLDSDTDLPSSSIRNFHRDSLNNAIESLESVPVSQRYFTSYMLPVSEEDLPEAKKMIEAFIGDFAAKFERKHLGNQVYQLNMNYIPLTRSGDRR